MSEVYTVWHKPNRKRARWRQIGEHADKGGAWDLMMRLMRASDSSGSWYVCSPGREYPTLREKPAKPQPTGELPWE